MSLYSQAVIVNLLQIFIKSNNVNSRQYPLQIIPHQELNGDILSASIKKNVSGKLCYLLASEPTVYHALIITYGNNEVQVNYVYVNDAPLDLKTLLSALKAVCHAPKLFTTPLKLASSQSVGFTEALLQLLTQDKITLLDIKNSIAKHRAICEAVTATQLAKLKGELPQLEPSIRLLCFYKYLICLLAKNPPLTLHQYLKEKSSCYRTRDIDVRRYLHLLAYETLFAIANADAEQTLANYLEAECRVFLTKMLQAEKIQFPKATIPQKFIELLQVFYYTSPMHIYGELAVQLPNLAQRLITHKAVARKAAITQLLKIIGMVTGAYHLITFHPVYLVKPIITYYTYENLVNFLYAERFNDATGEVTAPYLNDSFDTANWYLLISNLFLLLEAFCAEDTRAPIYIGLAIAVNWCFTLFAKRYLPNDSAERMTLLMLIGLFSRCLTNVVVGYAYEVSDNHLACDAASAQFEQAVKGQTVAIETKCDTMWTPSFFNRHKKLNVLATEQKGDTYRIECDMHDYAHPQKIFNCQIIQNYGKLLP